MIEIFINGNKTTRQKKEIYLDFVSTKVYDFVKNGMTSSPRDIIREWIVENYAMSEDDYGYMLDYIAIKI